MNDLQLIEELKNSLPSRRMLEVASVAIVDIGENTLIIKNRYPEWYLFKYDDFIHYTEKHGMEHDYEEIIGKKVRFDLSLFSRRGQEAAEKWLKLHEELDLKL